MALENPPFTFGLIPPATSRVVVAEDTLRAATATPLKRWAPPIPARRASRSTSVRAVDCWICRRGRQAERDAPSVRLADEAQRAQPRRPKPRRQQQPLRLPPPEAPASRKKEHMPALTGRRPVPEDARRLPRRDVPGQGSREGISSTFRSTTFAPGRPTSTDRGRQALRRRAKHGRRAQRRRCQRW